MLTVVTSVQMKSKRLGVEIDSLQIWAKVLKRGRGAKFVEQSYGDANLGYLSASSGTEAIYRKLSLG